MLIWFKPDAPAVATRYYPLGSALIVAGDETFVIESVPRKGKGADVVIRKTDDDLRPVGPRVEDHEGPGSERVCAIDGWPFNGAARRIAGFAIVSLPSGLFICDPNAPDL